MVDSPKPDFTQTHVVVAGDTLGKIAKQYYGDSEPVAHRCCPPFPGTELFDGAVVP